MRRFGGEGARQPDALLHAARQFVRVFLRPLVEVDELELPVDALLALGLRHAGELEAEADILLDGAPGQQAELLEHHGDVSAGAARRSVASSQETTSTILSPSRTSTWPRVTMLSRLTARSSVDLPEPDRPISTEISPSLTVEVGAGAAEHGAGLLEDLGARRALVEQPAAPRRVGRRRRCRRS